MFACYGSKQQIYWHFNGWRYQKKFNKGKIITDKIDKIYNKNPVFLKENNFNLNHAKKILIKNKLDLIPVVDDNLKLKNYITWKSFLQNNNFKNIRKINLPVIIMAGGKGTRLGIFSKILPKPLLPFDDNTLIETIINKFKSYGVKNFFLSVNYKANLIKSYFKDYKNFVNINFIHEKKPGGTAGSLSLIKNKIKSDFIVSNCDVVFNFDYYDLIKVHKSAKNDISLVVSKKIFDIPYGVCKFDKKGKLEEIIEKPQYDFLINTGLYVFNKKILNIIKKNSFLDMNDLLEKALSLDLKIGEYIINEDQWFDLGEWSDYKSNYLF